MKLQKTDIVEFQNIVLKQGAALYRDMPWRTDCNPYYVLVSEIMLQQTQVPRVLQKFSEFITVFPTLESLAKAEFYEVLQQWSGLGYNRRAKFLHQCAIQIQNAGVFPQSLHELQQLPGIGVNTAASILVYAFNEPQVFIETNIRTVYIYQFFEDAIQKIDEKELYDIVQQTLYTDNPRQWYWSLMDYGTHIKKTIGNYNKLSKMHSTQSKFEGSNRQKRAAIIRLLLQHGPQTIDSIVYYQKYTVSEVNDLLMALVKESMVKEQSGIYSIM